MFERNTTYRTFESWNQTFLVMQISSEILALRRIFLLKYCFLYESIWPLAYCEPMLLAYKLTFYEKVYEQEKKLCKMRITLYWSSDLRSNDIDYNFYSRSTEFLLLRCDYFIRTSRSISAPHSQNSNENGFIAPVWNLSKNFSCSLENGHVMRFITDEEKERDKTTETVEQVWFIRWTKWPCRLYCAFFEISFSREAATKLGYSSRWGKIRGQTRRNN